MGFPDAASNTDYSPRVSLLMFSELFLILWLYFLLSPFSGDCLSCSRIWYLLCSYYLVSRISINLPSPDPWLPISIDVFSIIAYHHSEILWHLSPFSCVSWLCPPLLISLDHGFILAHFSPLLVSTSLFPHSLSLFPFPLSLSASLSPPCLYYMFSVNIEDVSPVGQKLTPKSQSVAC